MTSDPPVKESILRLAWSKRKRGKTLNENEVASLRAYDRAHADQTTRMRIPADIAERLRKVAKSLGTSPHHYACHVLRADLSNQVVPKARLDDLQAKFDKEIRDALRTVDDTNRRLMVALRDREEALRERDVILEIMESLTNRFDDLCNVLGAPDAGEVDLSFLDTRETTKSPESYR